MKGSKFLYLIAAAAAVALVAWLMHRADRSAFQEQAIASGSRVLGDFAVNDVASVAISGPDGRVTLKRGDSGWGVAERADYPTDFERISELILRLSDLEAVQSVPVAESDYGVLALRTKGENIPREEAGTNVELQDSAGKTLASLVLGKTHMTAPQGIRPEIGGTANGRYVLPGSSRDNAYLVSETFSDLQTTPGSWIDKTFVRPAMPRRVEVKSTDGSWILQRDVSGGQWTMEGLRKGQSLDMTKAMSVDSMFTGMAVADVPDGPDDARVKPLQEKPVTVTADTFDGIRYTLTIGRGDGDNLPVKVSAEALPDEPPAPASPAEGQTPEQAAAQAEQAKKAKEAQLDAAEKFKNRVVFIPRNFLALFLSSRAEMLAGSSAPPAAPKKN
jgi:hypothetical protein